MNWKMLLAAVCFISLSATLSDRTAAQGKPIELKWASHMPDTNRIQKFGVVGLGTKIEQATKGRVKIVHFSGESLAKGKDVADAVAGGLADIGYVVTVYTPGRFPMSEMFMQYLGLPSGELSSRILWELFEKFPKGFKKDYEDFKVLTLSVSEPSHIGSRKPIRSAEDVKGVKIRATGNVSKIFKSLGAIPIPLPVVEMYSALETGVVDAYSISEHVTGDYRLYELVNNFTQLNAYTLIFAVLMNKDKWNSLPQDIQQQIMSVCGLKGSMDIGKVNDWTGQETMEKLAKMPGKEIITPSKEMVEAFRRAAEPFMTDSINKLEAKGLPGKAVYNEMVELVKKYEK
jgi:TRAP-type C4-dicarboxylate transport system substrate-binding protein